MMKNTDEEAAHWHLWGRLKAPLGMLLLLFLSSAASASWWMNCGGSETTIMNGSVNTTVHTFTANTTCLVNHSITNMTILVVGGGAAGGNGACGGVPSGGGGAGGLNFTNYSVTTGQNVTVIVGAGGVVVSSPVTVNGPVGGYSAFGTVNVSGGGGGTSCGENPSGSREGGSGGGGHGVYTLDNSSTAGIGISGQGHDGGAGANDPNYAGGGGGGYNSTGSAGLARLGGRGGTGAYFNLTAAGPICYAGGGGGGSFLPLPGARAIGGCPTGGIGGNNTLGYENGTNGANSTGSGGGGADNSGIGGNGGDGVVIITYPTAAFSAIDVYLISPNDSYSYPAATTTVPISFNCSGNSNTNYLANLTVNGVVNSTSIVSPNNASTNWTINSSVSGAFNWSVLCYNTSTSTNSTSRVYYILTSTVSVLANISTAYQLGDVFANVTGLSDSFTSLTMTYTWFNNGVNISNGSVATFNNTPTLIYADASPYTVGDKWNILVVANDGSTASPAVASANTTILDYFSGVQVSINPAYSLLSFTTQFNMTVAGGAVGSAYFFINTSNVSGINSGSGGNYVFTGTPNAPYTTTGGNYTGIWYYRATLPNGSFYELTNSSTVFVNISGFFICNASMNVTSINYTILDQTTLLALNATITTVFSISDPLGFPPVSFSVYNSSLAICISPAYQTFTSTVVETVNLTGYQTNSISRPSQIYGNNTTQNTKLLLVSSTTGLSNTITVLLTTGGAGAVGYQVLNYRYYPATNTYLLSASSITDNGGNVVQFLEPAPELYRLVILDPTNIIVWNQTGIAYCTSGVPCTYTVVLANTNVDYASTLGSAFNHGQLCSFSNTTNILTCNYSSVSTTIPAVSLNLSITNSNSSVVNTSGVVYTTTPSFVSIGVPNATGVYAYALYGYFTGTTQGAQIEFRVLLENGYITIGTPTTSPSAIFGLVGWFLAGLLSVGVALLFARIPAVMVISCGGVFLVCSIIGLITLSAPAFIAILVMTLVIAFVVK